MQQKQLGELDNQKKKNENNEIDLLGFNDEEEENNEDEFNDFQKVEDSENLNDVFGEY